MGINTCIGYIRLTLHSYAGLLLTSGSIYLAVSGMSPSIRLRGLALVLVTCLACVGAEVSHLDSNNVDTIFQEHELVLVNFYADWCHFSRQLMPIFEDTANKVKEELGARVILVKADCEAQSAVCQKFSISKYPTLKLFRYGHVQKKEYRGSRTPEAFIEYLKKENADVIEYRSKPEELSTFEDKKRHIVGYFRETENQSFTSFKRAASLLRDFCSFHVFIGGISDQVLPQDKQGSALYYAPLSAKADQYQHDLEDFDPFFSWVRENCQPLVREITFENAEELTEEGVPFLILFHHPDDLESVRVYQAQVEKELRNNRDIINPLFADGIKFQHPLHHLGKSEADLPLIAIDSFKHMYLYPHNVMNTIRQEGQLSQFIADLQSGKLHREFHYGPDSTETPQTTSTTTEEPPPYPVHENVAGQWPPEGLAASTTTTTEAPPKPLHSQKAKDKVVGQQGGGGPPSGNINRQTGERQEGPPSSTFDKLKPSPLRYTILGLEKDEL